MTTQPEAQRMTGAPNVVLPEHVGAPPSYEEAMGQSQSSVTHGQPTLPPLAFIDIMPRCLHPGNLRGKIMPQFQSFSDIISGANQWLRGNPWVKVWKCETVERRVNQDGTVDLESMLHRHSTFGFNVFVFGLRMWLTQRQSGDEPVQQLGILHVTPDTKEIDLSTVYMDGRIVMDNMVAARFGLRSHPMMMMRRTLMTYEGLQHTLAKLNSMLDSRKLNGRVLNVETATLKMSTLLEQQHYTPDTAAWCDTGSSSPRRLLKFLRVFYVIGEPNHGQIRMVDIKPEIERMPTMATPTKFESVEQMMARAQQWVRLQYGVRILNFESALVNVFEYGEKVIVDSDSTDEMESMGTSSKVLQMLRVFYMEDPSVGSFQETYMTSRLFLPARTGPRSFETMRQTMDRVAAWLSITGLPLFGVETTGHVFSGNPDGPGVNLERADIPLSRVSSLQWLTGIRLYFPTYFHEPPPDKLPPIPIYSGSESCTLL